MSQNVGRVLVDGAEAAERSKQVVGQGVRAWRRAGAERRVLVLRQERGADVDGVEVHGVATLEAAQAIVAVVADVGDVQRRRPGEGHLRAELPLPRGRHLRVVLEGNHGRNRLRAEALADRAHRAVAEILRGRDRRVARDREHGVAVRTVVEEADAAAEDEALVAADVVGRTEAGSEHQCRPGVAVLGDAVTGLLDAVDGIPGPRNRRADGDLRVGRVGCRQDLAVARIHRIAGVARAGVAPLLQPAT